MTSSTLLKDLEQNHLRLNLLGSDLSAPYLLNIIMHVNEIIDPQPNQMELPLEGGRAKITSQSIAAWKPAMCQFAQQVYNEWDQSGEDGDPELGFGGICDLIAEQICHILGGEGIECISWNSGGMGENHTSVIANLADGVFEVDIPPHVYETGSGYTWYKKPEVVFDPHDVVITRLEQPMTDEQFAQQYHD